MLDPCIRFALLLIKLVASPTFLYFFQLALLSCSRFIYQRSVRFNLVVGSLLSSLDYVIRQQTPPQI